MEKVFTITKILYWYDGPLMVQGKTDTGGDIFALIVDMHPWNILSDEEFAVLKPCLGGFWIAAEVSPDIMEGILFNKVDLRDIFLVHRLDGHAYTGNFGGGVGEVATLMPLADPISDEWLPLKDCFLFPTMKFFVDEVIDYYDGPLAIKGHWDYDDDISLALEAQTIIFGMVYDEIDHDRHWNVVRIPHNIYDEILANKVTIRDVFLKYRIGEIWRGTFAGFEGDVVRLDEYMPSTTPVENLKLPKEGVFLRLSR